MGVTGSRPTRSDDGRAERMVRMKLNKLCEKVDTYNELAQMLGNPAVRIYFVDVTDSITFGEHVNSYKELRKYIKSGFNYEIADQLLQFDGWQFNKDFSFTWNNGEIVTFCAELTEN